MSFSNFKKFPILLSSRQLLLFSPTIFVLLISKKKLPTQIRPCSDPINSFQSEIGREKLSIVIGAQFLQLHSNNSQLRLSIRLNFPSWHRYEKTKNEKKNVSRENLKCKWFSKHNFWTTLFLNSKSHEPKCHQRRESIQRKENRKLKKNK